MEKEKKIVVDNGIKARLLEFGTYPTIRKALKGDANTPQKIKIREKAIELGGVFIESKIEKSMGIENSSICTPFI